MAKNTGKAYFMISVVAQRYDIHPQTLRLYEREGLLKPSRTEGNTRLYSEEDLEQLETILTLTRELGVNLAGVEIILNMRRKMEQMQGEVNEFMVREARAGARARGLGAAARCGAREVVAVRSVRAASREPDATVSSAEPPTRRSRSGE
ncbi:MAG: helix-turn-helix transcriptional regulator [Vicinamibacterales bacterium]